ncbi:MAG: hypothetical protein AABY07_07710 [Nanoarchaeota archaeon]
METLERTLKNIDFRKEDRRILVEKPIYAGLKKLEDKPYMGGTSIKYWM